jgi:hypothetical protein
MGAAELLEDRVAELDEPTENRLAWARVRDYWEECGKNNEAGFSPFEEWPCRDLAYSAEVMSAVVGAGGAEQGATKRISASAADQIIASSDLLSRMAARQPEIVVGPLDADRQFWVTTQPFEGRPPRVAEPSKLEFQSVAEGRTLYAKPRAGGMFTSTGACGRPGMWRMYLEMNDPSSLHRKPWHTWALTVQDHAVIREITCAEDWVSFVEDYHAANDDAVHPDWRKASAEYDAVHITMRAIAAIDGIEFECANGVITPSAWGVESTLWLRWRFAGQSLVDTAV